MKTTTGVSVEPMSGGRISPTAAWTACEAGHAGGDLGVDGFDDDDGVVDDQADGGGDAAEGHEVEALAAELAWPRMVTSTVTGMTTMATSVDADVFQKEIENEDGEEEAEEDGFQTLRRRSGRGAIGRRRRRA